MSNIATWFISASIPIPMECEKEAWRWGRCGSRPRRNLTDSDS